MPLWSNGTKPPEDTAGTVAGAYGVSLLSSVGLPTTPLSKVPISDPSQVTDVSAHLARGSQPEKESRQHPCLECGRSFASSALLLHHSKDTHGRERIHVCPVCSKAFKRATHLKVQCPQPPLQPLPGAQLTHGQ